MDSKKAQAIFGLVYGFSVDRAEALNEVLSLERKKRKMTLDDMGEDTVARLEVAYGMNIEELAERAAQSWAR